jgi:hypothetical protein
LELSWPRIQKTRRWQPVTALNPQICTFNSSKHQKDLFEV